MTSVFIGWTLGFIRRFTGAWLIGFVVAFPTSIAITPLLRRLVKVVCEQYTSAYSYKIRS
jgi:hypothetical protein